MGALGPEGAGDGSEAAASDASAGGPSKRAVVLLNERAAHLGNFEPVLREHGYAVEVIDAAAPEAEFSAALAASAEHGRHTADLVIVLGSSAGVYEASEHPFIASELAYVRERLAAQRPVLGVCFGSQLVAAALGAEVRPGHLVDVGYRTVVPTDAGRSSPVRHVAGVPVAEWHGDTFDLPAGTVRLASSEAYENEAFGIGDWLLAVQFHPELTDEMHEEWLASDEEYVTRNGHDPAALRAERDRFGAPMQSASQRMLADFLDRLPAAPTPDASA